MAGIVEVEWIPSPRLVAAEFDVAAARLQDMNEPASLVREQLIAQTAEAFASETSPEGQAWPPWSASYNRPPGNILVLSGDLEGYATSEEAWQIETSLDETSIGFDLHGGPPYTAIHQFGGIAGKGVTIPARSFVGLSPATANAAYDIFSIWAASTLFGTESPRIVNVGASGFRRAGYNAAGKFGFLPST